MGKMFNPPHPGEILSGTWIEPMGLSITAPAEKFRVSRKTLSEIVNGKSSISPEMVLRLELAFGKSAASWLGHQAAFDLWRLEARRANLGVEPIAA